METKTIAILLTVHNRKEKTMKCLEHIHSQLPVNGFTTDIFMTDDGCTDGTREAVTTAFPQVRIVNGDGNLFWNRGMHKAWQEAASTGYDYYLWINDDTFLYDGAIEQALLSSRECSDTAIIVGATQSEATGKSTYGLRDAKTGKLLVPNGMLQEGHGLNGNFVLVSKIVFEKLGNLDSHFHHSGGDTDYGLRAEERNIRLLLHKEYIGTCEQHQALSKWCNPDYPLRERWQSLNKPTGMPLKELFYLERRHYGYPKACFHFVTTILHCCFPKLWIEIKH